ncbi:plasmid pRiA4b ORF-3 family protein [Clostridium sp. LBM24168]
MNDAIRFTVAIYQVKRNSLKNVAEMINAISEVTGIQAYKYHAFELLVTLDLDIYKAVRKIVVPAYIQFRQLHKVLQSVFDWRNYHLYDFTVFDKDKCRPVGRIAPFGEDLEYDEEAILMENHTLSEFLTEQKYIIYTYDMGDNWKHEIQLINVIDEYDKESPYLLEASGQTPPEDVGGVSGFIDFREIMMNPNSPEYKGMKEWVGYWTVELSDWEKRPRVISI